MDGTRGWSVRWALHTIGSSPEKDWGSRRLTRRSGQMLDFDTLPAFSDLGIADRTHLWPMDADAEGAGTVLVRAVQFTQPLARRHAIGLGAGAHCSAVFLCFCIGQTGRKPMEAIPGELDDL